MTLRLAHIAFFILLMPVLATAQGTDEQLAAQYFRNGEFDKASVIYDKLYRKSNDAFYHRYYLDCLIELRDFDGAVKSMEKRIKREGDPVLLVNLGNIYQKAGDERKAQATFDQALKELQHSQPMIDAMGQAFEAANQREWAVRTYQKGRRMLNGLYPYYFELAELHNAMGKWDLALNELFDAITEDPAFMGKVRTMLTDMMGRDQTGKRTDFFEQHLLDRIQRDPDKDVFPELLIWHFTQKKDFRNAFVQAKALDRRNKEDGSRIVELGHVARAARDYDLAAEAFRYVIKKGRENYHYISCRRELVKSLYLKVTEKGDHTPQELTALENEFLSTLDEVGRNGAAVPLMTDLSELYVFHMDKPQKGIDLLYEAIEAPGITQQDLAKAKLGLGDALLFTDEVWEATLLYSQVEKMLKNDELGRDAKLRNAKLAYFTGQFDWATAQLNVLKAATSQYISNDAIYLALLITDNTTLDTSTTALEMFARADLLMFRNRNTEAWATMDSVMTLFPGHSLSDDILYRKAQILEKRGQFTEAVELLQRIVTDYAEDILADDALYMLAELYEDRLGQRDRAMELFQKLLLDHPGSLLTADARKRYRALRGDLVN